jgi:hypothetical protein
MLKEFGFFLEEFFLRLYFCMVKYLNFHNSSFFCLKILFNVPLYIFFIHSLQLSSNTLLVGFL